MDRPSIQVIRYFMIECLNQTGLQRRLIYSKTVGYSFSEKNYSELEFTAEQLKTTIEARKSSAQMFFPREFVQTVHDKLNLTTVFAMFNKIEVRFSFKLWFIIEKY